jgi:hypothetical protein
MLVQIVDKQRHAVNVVKTALLSAGITERAVCVEVECHPGSQCSLFVSAPVGANIEPFYVTGKTLAEAVRNMLATIKPDINRFKSEASETAPF